MAKVKVKRKSTFIDMTAMSDVTVLLLTFFMLTSTFIQKEPVTVTTPGSVSEIKIPESDILQILVDPQGKVFMTLDKQEDRVEVLKKVGEEYGITFTPEEINKFRLANSFGVPISQMKAFWRFPRTSRTRRSRSSAFRPTARTISSRCGLRAPGSRTAIFGSPSRPIRRLRIRKLKQS